ncbi:PREDICTED: TOM1-like protein 2 isoform X3 [Elephantulus edwardii]|uniref:TOM1-like protein 2 isoform X3 n=1 Tax=Elephantulus edwardii TaxID=28737 RepID=UPI0003F0DC94|nr:PREDICTED: TOM1-like protein 2 isoform X3 [Elephantulus edwardii]
MEFLLGNPFSTPVGQCLEKATDGSLQSEDWTLNMEICDIINETEEGPKDAIRALKKRLNGNRNYREVMLALTIARLRSELDVVRGNTKVMSEMLTEMVPGQEDLSDLELLQELNRTCRAMQERIVELIPQVSNEEVTEELLHVNDNLNNVFLRYERFEHYRSTLSTQKATNGVLNEVTEDNLIDLGPGSPAVVSPMPGNAAPPSSLSSQLAGLDLGSESMSGTLSSLKQCNPHDGLDMFTQTRRSSLAEQRKTVNYEDPQAAGGLSSTQDSRPQSSEGTLLSLAQQRGKDGNSDLDPIDSWLITQGMIPVVQPCIMDDIELWLRTDLKGDDAEEGVTSEEFDKFLEERAKAAEMVPSFPSLPAETPTLTSSGRKKPDRSEDTLFAL